jgi:hypothetical protein
LGSSNESVECLLVSGRVFSGIHNLRILNNEKILNIVNIENDSQGGQE